MSLSDMKFEIDTMEERRNSYQKVTCNEQVYSLGGIEPPEPRGKAPNSEGGNGKNIGRRR